MKPTPKFSMGECVYVDATKDYYYTHKTLSFIKENVLCVIASITYMEGRDMYYYAFKHDSFDFPYDECCLIKIEDQEGALLLYDLQREADY